MTTSTMKRFARSVVLHHCLLVLLLQSMLCLNLTAAEPEENSVAEQRTAAEEKNVAEEKSVAQTSSLAEELAKSLRRQQPERWLDGAAEELVAEIVPIIEAANLSEEQIGHIHEMFAKSVVGVAPIDGTQHPILCDFIKHNLIYAVENYIANGQAYIEMREEYLLSTSVLFESIRKKTASLDNIYDHSMIQKGLDDLRSSMVSNNANLLTPGCKQPYPDTAIKRMTHRCVKELKDIKLSGDPQRDTRLISHALALGCYSSVKADCYGPMLPRSKKLLQLEKQLATHDMEISRWMRERSNEVEKRIEMRRMELMQERQREESQTK